MEYKFDIFDTVEAFHPYDEKNLKSNYRGILAYRHNIRHFNGKFIYPVIELIDSKGRIIKQNNVGLNTCRMVLFEKTDRNICNYYNSYIKNNI